MPRSVSIMGFSAVQEGGRHVRGYGVNTGVGDEDIRLSEPGKGCLSSHWPYCWERETKRHNQNHLSFWNLPKKWSKTGKYTESHRVATAFFR